MTAKKAVMALLFLLVFAVEALAAAEGAAHDAGPGWLSPMQIARIFNAAVLVGLLVYLLKGRLVNFFAERRAQIQKDLADAKMQKEQAEALIAEYKTKISGMEAEIERMRGELRKTAEVESDKIISNADRMAATMLESAKMAAEQEVRKAKTELRNEAVQLAVQLAESLIREKINEDDRKKLVEDYFVKVGGMK